jgi:NaMN:DMB phosphoribosyltransferase
MGDVVDIAMAMVMAMQGSGQPAASSSRTSSNDDVKRRKVIGIEEMTTKESNAQNAIFQPS